MRMAQGGARAIGLALLVVGLVGAYVAMHGFGTRCASPEVVVESGAERVVGEASCGPVSERWARLLVGASGLVLLGGIALLAYSLAWPARVLRRRRAILVAILILFAYTAYVELRLLPGRETIVIEPGAQCSYPPTTQERISFRCATRAEIAGEVALAASVVVLAALAIWPDHPRLVRAGGALVAASWAPEAALDLALYGWADFVLWMAIAPTLIAIGLAVAALAGARDAL